MHQTHTFLQEKSRWLRRETIRLHGLAPETRLASSLSAVEILVALYYGGILAYDAQEPFSPARDRLVISKGHGSISAYPLLADLGFFDPAELERICKKGSFLGAIPDTNIPGYETINGSLGLGLGLGCGMALALKQDAPERSVFVLSGDGELFVGAVWEAVMLAAQTKLDNIILVVDRNKLCMLDYCRNIIDLDPLATKFTAFGWEAQEVDGHDPDALAAMLGECKMRRNGTPKVVIADTVKGKGVPRLEADCLCHIKSLAPEEIPGLLGDC